MGKSFLNDPFHDSLTWQRIKSTFLELLKFLTIVRFKEFCRSSKEILQLEITWSFQGKAKALAFPLPPPQDVLTEPPWTGTDISKVQEVVGVNWGFLKTWGRLCISITAYDASLAIKKLKTQDEYNLFCFPFLKYFFCSFFSSWQENFSKWVRDYVFRRTSFHRDRLPRQQSF